VDSRAGLDSEGKPFVSAGDQTWIARSYRPKPDTILTELPRLLDPEVKGKAIPLHAMEALGGRGDIALTSTRWG
jgi:hypothetical protein